MEDLIEQTIGSYGRYQIMIFALLLLSMFPSQSLITNSSFLLPAVNFVCADNNVTNGCPCDTPIFDRSVFTNTVVMQWNLVCEKKWYASFTQSAFQAGLLVGSITFGTISDRFGRRMSMSAALAIVIIFMASSGLTPEYWSFTLFRFLSGIGSIGSILCSYTIYIELFGMKLRPYMANFGMIIFVVTYTVQPGILYYLRDSIHSLMVIPCGWIFVFGYYWILPESPRWLVAIGRKEEAKEVIMKIAKWNGRSVDKISTIVDDYDKETNSESNYKSDLRDLFKTNEIRKRTILSVLIWMACSFTFYGINQYIGHLHGNIFLNVSLIGAAHIPGLLLSILFSVKFRRKPTLILNFLVASAAFILLIFCEDNTARLITSSISALCIFITFLISYLFTSELYPTILRNSGLGAASLFARVGSITSPFVVDIGVEWGTLALFSIATLFAAILVLFLPETKENVLANSIKEIKEQSVQQDTKL